MIFGKGLDATNSSKKPEQYALMISLFKKDVVRRLAYDLKLAGQCAIQVIYSKDKKTIQRVEHLPIETLRAEKCSADDKQVQAYYYHPDWANAKPSDEPKRIPAFGVSNSPQPIEILYIKPYKAGMYYYSNSRLSRWFTIRRIRRRGIKLSFKQHFKRSCTINVN